MQSDRKQNVGTAQYDQGRAGHGGFRAKEELEERVEVEDQSLAIAMDNKDTMPKNVISLSQYVSIVNPITILWKTTLFYK